MDERQSYESYGPLAALYDRLMDDYDYAAWSRYYIDRIRSKCPTVQTVLDCGCGTGTMSLALAQAGWRVIASDQSEAMLRQAVEKARRAGREIRFVQQDMRAIELPRPVDAIVCACDGVNYLTGERDAARFFERAFRYLTPGGVLMFDVSSREKLFQMVEERVYYEDRDDVTYIWVNEMAENAPIVTMTLIFFARERDGRYRRFEEIHRQRAYTVEELRAGLEARGFVDVEIWGDQTDVPPQADEKRWHIAARKPKA